MNNLALLNERRIHDLRAILETSGSLSFEEIEEIIFRTRSLLEKCPRVVGIEGLVKRITALKNRQLGPDSFEAVYNHVNELNLIHFFALNKRMPVAVERKARTDNNKSIDIIVRSEKTYYIEVKNLNKPKLTPREFDFLEHLKEILQNARIQEPYRIHLNILNHQKLKVKISLIDFILEKLESHKNISRDQSTSDKLNFWFFPSKHSPVLSLAFVHKPELLYIDLECFSFNSNRLDFSIKKRIIEGIKDTENKFLDPGEGHVNILVIPIGDYDFRNAVIDIQDWYYDFLPAGHVKKTSKLNLSPPPQPSPHAWDNPPLSPLNIRGDRGGLPKKGNYHRIKLDPLLEHYDLYSRIIDFHTKGKIDVMVTVRGKGLLEDYSWEVFPPDSARSGEVARLFRC